MYTNKETAAKAPVSKSILEIKASEMTHGNTGFNFEGGSGTGFYSSTTVSTSGGGSGSRRSGS